MGIVTSQRMKDDFTLRILFQAGHNSLYIVRNTHDILKITRSNMQSTSKALPSATSFEDFVQKLYCKYGVFSHPEEAKQIQEKIESVVTQVAQDVSERLGSMKLSVAESGSFYEGTKVGEPNEFDFLFCLDDYAEKHGVEFTCMPDQDNLSTSMKIQTTENIPKLIKKLVKTIRRTLVDAQLPEELEFHEATKVYIHRLETFNTFPKHRSKKGPATTVHFIWNGMFYKNFEISVDISPAINLEHCPSEKLEFFRRIPEQHANYSTYMSAFTKGLRVVPNTKIGGFFDDPVWDLSFSKQEKALLLKMFEFPCTQECYKVVKIIRDILVFNSLGQDSSDIDSYVIKTLFFWEFEHFPNAQHWKQEDLPQRVLDILQSLFESLKKGFLPNFFLPQKNVLSHVFRCPSWPPEAKEDCITSVKEFAYVCQHALFMRMDNVKKLTIDNIYILIRIFRNFSEESGDLETMVETFSNSFKLPVRIHVRDPVLPSPEVSSEDET